MTYQPFNIGNNFRIAPPDAQPSTDRIDLIMHRGAFGSGEHETTESCLEIMETMSEIEEARVLDLGSGTGILSIAALKLGAAQAVCVDIEASAVETAKLNCSYNGVEDRVTHIIGTLDNVDASEFDIILANIYSDILIGLATTISSKIKDGGFALLSGIAWEHNYDVRNVYKGNNCATIKNKLLETYSTILLQHVPNEL